MDDQRRNVLRIIGGAPEPGRNTMCHVSPEQVVVFFPDFPGAGFQDLSPGHQHNPNSLGRALGGGRSAAFRQHPRSNAVDTIAVSQRPLAKGFPQEPFGSVPLDGAPHFLRGDHRAGRVVGRQQVNYEESSDFLDAFLVDLVEFILIRQRPPLVHGTHRIRRVGRSLRMTRLYG